MSTTSAPTPPAPGGPLGTPEPWNLVADAYTTDLLPAFELFSRDALTLAKLPPAADVLDVATGPGTLALLAAQAGARVSAIDFSEKMLSQLRARAAKLGLTVDLRVGDGQALPFADASFDGAFSMFGLMFFPDRPAGFRQLWRVLRPGGRALVASWAPFEGPFAAALASMRTHVPGMPAAGDSKLPLGDPDTILSEMRGAGFASVAVHTATHALPQPSLQAFWNSLQYATAPIVLLRRKLGETVWAEVAPKILADLEREFGPGPVNETGTAFIGLGRKD